jgi:hypothetical protein
MSHERGQIERYQAIDGIGYRVYTGCQLIDDYYTCDDYATALRMALELIADQV